MKKILILLFLILLACSDKKETESLTKFEKLENIYSNTDLALENYKEKIALMSIIKEIPNDSVYLILRDYYAKTDLQLESDFTEKIIDTISRNRKMSKQKIASIIFNFKYEMQTRDEIEQNFIDSYEPPEQNQEEPDY